MKYILLNIAITALIIWFINKLLFKKSKLTRIEGKKTLTFFEKDKMIHLFSLLMIGFMQLIFTLLKDGMNFLNTLIFFLTILLVLRLVHND